MKLVITNNGLNLMNQTQADGATQFWIGYYGLAYVPDEKRFSIDDTTPAADPISPDMNVLTLTGDNIYNIFQGSMTPVGFDTDIGDSAAYRLFNECMYTANVAQKFRYVLDEDGNNQLVVFADSEVFDKSQEAGLVEYQRYQGTHLDSGTNEPTASELPVPAPLYYLGEPVNYNVSDEYAEGIVSKDAISSDTRVYKGNAEGEPPEVTEEPTHAWNGNDNKYSWTDSEGHTYGTSLSTTGLFKNLNSYWQYQSVSNFNRFHAPANTNGYFVDYEPACRNLAKATRLFPISHYDVINEQKNEQVANVQYTVSLDLGDVFSKVSNRSTAYYQPNGDNTKLVPVEQSDIKKNYRMGVKFNRIGIYAVRVSLRAFDAEASGNTNCGNHSIQMQIVGNEEPVLFAVMDLPSPIVLSEDGIQKYVFKFQMKMTDRSALVTDSSVYYNLYENDAITWYKNQLIANASTAEAVTTLGVQMAYLRQQINDMNGGNSACGIGDDGDRYALEGHTHDYLKNIVDSTATGNGAVRGIYTQQEGRPLKFYRTDGRSIIYDETLQKIRYSDDPTGEEEVPFLVNTASYTSGNYSMTLGSDSATMGSHSINMSDYGIIGSDSKGVLMLGGTGKIDSYNDHHLAASTARNTIIASDEGEFSHIRGSMWLSCGTGEIICSGSVLHTVAVGKNDITNNLFNRYSNIENGLIGYTKSGYSTENLFIGYNRVMSDTFDCVIAGSGERGSQQSVSAYNPFSDIDAESMKNSNFRDDRDVFPSVGNGVSRVMSAGFGVTYGSSLSDSLVIGRNSTTPVDTANSIMVGSRQNTATPYYSPSIVLTVDEFNERYGEGSSYPYPSNDPIWINSAKPSTDASRYGDVVVIGSGELTFRDGQGTGTIKSRNVKGVTLYISYSSYIWNTGVTIGSDNSDSTVFGDGARAHQYADLYRTAGHSKNMIMLGDDINVGYGSETSIVLGDYSGTRKITFKNSFVNFLGDREAFNRNSTSGPCSTFDNIWWIGHAKGEADGSNFTGHVVAAQADSLYDSGVYRDRFVFIGENDKEFAHSYWYGMSSSDRPLDIAKYPNSLEWEYSYQDVYQTTKSPMIYTGGLALGGYGTVDCNFMLLKVGYSRTSSYSPQSTFKPTCYQGINTNNNMVTGNSNISKIIRCDDVNGPWVSTDENTTYIERPAEYSLGILPSGTTELSYQLSAGTTIKDGTDVIFSIYMQDPTHNTWSTGDPLTTVTATVSESGLCTATLPAGFSTDTICKVSYTGISDDGLTVYDYYNPSRSGEHHFMMDSPFKGMALVVQDKQELDGTLHVGLGEVMGGTTCHGNKKYIRVQCGYVSSNVKLVITGSVRCDLEFPARYNSTEQDLNHRYDFVSKSNGFEFHGSVTFTQSGNTGTKPDTSANPIVAELSSLHFFFDLDEGYMIFMEPNPSGSTTNIDFTNNSDNFARGYGGHKLIPSYFYTKGATAFQMFPKFSRIVVYPSGDNLSYADSHKYDMAQDSMYKLTPVEWYNTSGWMIHTDSGDMKDTHPVCIEELDLGDNYSEGIVIL